MNLRQRQLIVQDMQIILNKIQDQEAILLKMGITTPQIIMDGVRRQLLCLHQDLQKRCVETLRYDNGLDGEQRLLLEKLGNYAGQEVCRWKNSL